MRAKRLFALIMAAALLAGCQTVTVPTDKVKNIKTVGVISAIGDTMDMQHIGTMVFSNETKSVAIADWNIDAFVIDRIQAQLGQRFQFVPLQYDPSLFRSVSDSDSVFDKAGPLKPAGRLIKSSVTPQGLDAYLIVTKAGWRDDIGGTNQRLFGLGFYDHNFFGDHRTALYAGYGLFVVDGHSFAVLGQKAARDASHSIDPVQAAIGGTIPFESVSYGLWSDFAAGPAGQKQQVEATLKSIIDRSLTKLLRDLNLLE